MFFNTIKNKIILLLLLFIVPNFVLAYSDYVIAGGENIGISLHSNGVIIVGSYEIDGNNPAKESGLNNGDKIIKVNDIDTTSIDKMLSVIENLSSKDNIKITYIRGNKEYDTNISLKKDINNIYKTGLYVKDSITGVGTLTFIDPNTKTFGALGHEIIEKNTGQKLEIRDGNIYSSTVTGITKSSIGTPGEKNAKYDNTNIFGYVRENASSGIFGEYTKEIPDKRLYKVANPSETNEGEATILTVIEEDNVEEFKINILKVNFATNSSKNILFEVTDNNLLKKTGGIVQGMSGSPIIQNDKIVGAVTHVVVDEPTKGYGTFITKMLEEAEN